MILYVYFVVKNDITRLCWRTLILHTYLIFSCLFRLYFQHFHTAHDWMTRQTVCVIRQNNYHATSKHRHCIISQSSVKTFFIGFLSAPQKKKKRKNINAHRVNWTGTKIRRKNKMRMQTKNYKTKRFNYIYYFRNYFEVQFSLFFKVN